MLAKTLDIALEAISPDSKVAALSFVQDILVRSFVANSSLPWRPRVPTWTLQVLGPLSLIVAAVSDVTFKCQSLSQLGLSKSYLRGC